MYDVDVVYVSFVIRTGTSDLEGGLGEPYFLLLKCPISRHFYDFPTYILMLRNKEIEYFQKKYLKTVEWPLLSHHLVFSHRSGKLGMSQPALECLFSDIELI